MDIALALIFHPYENKVLIAQRPSETHLPNFWEFPGGKCQPGETLAECAVREAREEVGLTVHVLESWPAITYAYPERTVILHPFLCRAESGEARPLASQQIIWVTPSEFANYAFPPANAPLLRRLQEL